MRLHRSARHYVLEPCASFIAIARLSIFLTCYTRLACAQNYDYTGGVALRYPNDTCPSNTEYIGTSFYPNCCPTWTDGAPSGSGYCCASKADCYNTVARAPKCADPSWTYCYDPESDAKIGFCCLQGWQCEVEKDSSGNSLGVGCNDPNRALASTQSAAITSLTAYEIPGASSTSASSVKTSSSKATSPATTAPAGSAQDSTSTKSSTGLSTGAKAGIGVGAAVGGVALVGLVAWGVLSILKRRERDAAGGGRAWDQPSERYSDSYGAPKMAQTSSAYYGPRELDGREAPHRSELEGSHGGHEMSNERK